MLGCVGIDSPGVLLCGCGWMWMLAVFNLSVRFGIGETSFMFHRSLEI